MSTREEADRAMPGELIAHWRALGLWPDLSLGQAMARMAREKPAAPLHLVGSDGEQNWTLAEIHQRGRQLAGSLHALCLQPGETIAMQLPNGLDNAVLYQAAALLGCTILPIVPIYGGKELGEILADSGAAALVMPGRWRNIDFAERIARLPELPALRHRIIAGEEVPPGAMALAALPQGPCPEVFADPDACALLLYTSGTTAAPKGVRHSSRSLIAELLAGQRSREEDEFGLSPWPTGHIAGTLATMGHALVGRAMVLMEGWEPGLAAELVERFGVRQMSGTPFHLSGLMDAAARDRRDISSVSQFIVGATTVPPALVAAAEDIGIRCCRCYGSTELPTSTQCEPGDPLDKRLNTDGRPNPGIDIRIVDDFGKDVPSGVEGEVAVRGAERFIGYTDPALDAVTFIAGGYYLSGDIGRIDSEGYLAITDRKKDIIIRGGENISSREVEELLLQVPGVREAAAIAAPDARLGERVCAVVTLDGNAPVTIAAIDEVFRQIGVARQKTPELLAVLEEFPRTPSGKIQKAELRAALAEGRLALQR